jgi:hypothetical protein
MLVIITWNSKSRFDSWVKFYGLFLSLKSLTLNLFFCQLLWLNHWWVVHTMLRIIWNQNSEDWNYKFQCRIVRTNDCRSPISAFIKAQTVEIGGLKWHLSWNLVPIVCIVQLDYPTPTFVKSKGTKKAT